MAFFEEVTLTDSIKIKTTPEKIFSFLTSIVDDHSYRAWHKKDHVSFRWLKGQPWTEGSVIYAEEYIITLLLEGDFENARSQNTSAQPLCAGYMNTDGAITPSVWK